MAMTRSRGHFIFKRRYCVQINPNNSSVVVPQILARQEYSMQRIDSDREKKAEVAEIGLELLFIVERTSCTRD